MKQKKKKGFSKTRLIAGIFFIALGIAFIINFFPIVFPLSALETGQLTTQGALTGKVLDYAATINRDLGFKFSSSIQFAPQTSNPLSNKIALVRTVDGQNPVTLETTVLIVNDGLPHPTYPVKELDLQPIITIPYSELQSFGNGKHLITFDLKGKLEGALLDSAGQPTTERILAAPTIGEVSFEIWIDGSACNEVGGNTENYIQFTGGRTFTLADLQGFRSFCYERPLRKTTGNGIMLAQTLEEYALLVKGSYLTVPSGEIWTLNWIGETQAGTPTTCILDANGNCLPAPIIEFHCSADQIQVLEPYPACFTNPFARANCANQEYAVVQCSGLDKTTYPECNTQDWTCIKFNLNPAQPLNCNTGDRITLDQATGQIVSCANSGLFQEQLFCESGLIENGVCKSLPKVELGTIELNLGRQLNLFSTGIGIFFIVIGAILIFVKRS